MLHGTGLTGETTALNRRHHVEFTFDACNLHRLAQDQLEHGTCEVDVLVLAVDGDLAGARLDPDAGNGVLPLAGRVGAAELVTDRLTVDGDFGFSAFGSRASPAISESSSSEEI